MPTIPSTVCDCHRGNAYNCSSFTTHTEAQACYEACFAATGRDVHRLDGDRDGVACEALPGSSPERFWASLPKGLTHYRDIGARNEGVLAVQRL